MSDQILINGLRVLANCGAYEPEQSRLQPFEIALEINYDQALPGKSDSLNDAVDYEPICNVISDLVKNEKYFLLEKMAQRIVEEIFFLNQKINQITITLSKVRPPLQTDVSSVSVKIMRERF
jgi:7,8-dihydroneopterin aldolase/epimerase/oxygenase